MTEEFDTGDLGVTDDLSESLGYRLDFDWTSLPEEETRLHDEIAEMSVAELRELRIGELSDLQRWALAIAYEAHGEMRSFERICRELVQGPAEHDALEYAEIATELLNELLMEGRLDEVRELLDRVDILCEDDGFTKSRHLAMLAILEDKRDQGLRMFQSLVDEAGTDSLQLFDLADDLLTCGALPEATQVFGEVMELARDDNDQELVDAASEMLSLIEELVGEES